MLIVSTIITTPLMFIIVARKERFGWGEIISLNFLFGLFLSVFILNVINGLNELEIENGDEAIFGPGHLVLFAVLSFIPTGLFSILTGLFGERDPIADQRGLLLPISVWNERFHGVKRRVYPENISCVYPRWIAVPKKSRWPKQPEYESRRQYGYGIRLRDGRRFGYSLLSRAFLRKDLVKLLGEREFKRIRRDHARLTNDEWEYLKKRCSHWYSNLDAPVMLFVISNMALMFFIIGPIMVFFQDPVLMPPIVIILLGGFFFPTLVASLIKMKSHDFYKGTIFRMRDRGEKLPSWLKITSNQISTVIE
ncbi:MAG: hypothetical protein JXA22_09340 [Candidatus Thermoplasmatota archaeon]|nr:hypothetical protein [Candidatus Thermoplasmatota archaeon]